MSITEVEKTARSYLLGMSYRFEEINAWWQQLKREDKLPLAREVLAKLRSGKGLLAQEDRRPLGTKRIKEKLCQQHAELTSKDSELGVSLRHDAALAILGEVFDLEDPALDGDTETLGIAGGICKRKWLDLGQYEDLLRSARYYARGAKGPVGDDGYCHINEAFLCDLLAKIGESKEDPLGSAKVLRERILDELTPLDQVEGDKQEWNAASRAEALFGLRRYREATAAIQAVPNPSELWKMRTTATQLGTLAHLHHAHPLKHPDIQAFFGALLPNSPQAVRSVVNGKVGLALSGGGFRASFYHLGVLARLAELDVLRHVDVLSCVSGGSIVGTCYWLLLRDRLLRQAFLSREDYVLIVQDLIEHFSLGVAQNLRGQVQPTKLEAVWRFFNDAKGAIETMKVAEALEQYFYAPLWPHENVPIFMHDLPFTPKDHARSEPFHPGQHNWLRVDKVPALVLNATTVNTGHAWQFTPTWMGESPWSIHPAADSVPRLQWHWYCPEAKWQMRLGMAVAASACVPGLFDPVRLDEVYDGCQVQLVDGGVHDNQGTVALLAHNCQVLLISDAAGQLLFEKVPQIGLKGLGQYAMRANGTLMERVRLANFADLSAREQSRRLRGLMFLHMKDGLDADPIRLKFAQETCSTTRAPLSSLGIRKDFQQAIAQLRTDLDAFSEVERLALMACGYRMAAQAFDRDLRHCQALYEDTPYEGQWPFHAMLSTLVSIDPDTPERAALLDLLQKGSQRVI